jgi:hypothetical protein
MPIASTSRRGLLRAGAAAMVSSLACARTSGVPAPPTAASDPADLVLVGGTVIDPHHDHERAQSVVIRGDTITLVARGREPDARARIDLDGRFVAPGLVDGHGHLPAPGEAIDVARYLVLQLMAGVTTVRCMQGTTQQLGWRDEIERHDRLGPRLLVGGMIAEAGAQGVEAQVRAHVEAGYDFIKLIGEISRADHSRLGAACKAQAIPLAGHLPSAADLDDALAAGQDLEHLHGHHQALAAGRSADDLARATVDAGCVVCPTIEFYAVMYGVRDPVELRARAELEAVSSEQRRAWIGWQSSNVPDEETRRQGKAWYDAALVLVRALADAGAGMLASPSPGPFIVPGLSRARELEHYAHAGIDARTQWIASTRLPNARGLVSHVPALVDGAGADLVVLEADPRRTPLFETTVHAVATRGRYVAVADLERRLHEGAPRTVP